MAFEELLVVVAFGPLVLPLSSPPPVALRKNDADCFSSEAGAPSEKRVIQTLIKTLSTKPKKLNTLEHDFNGHEVNGIHGVYGKKCYDRAFHLVNKLHDLPECLTLAENFM